MPTNAPQCDPFDCAHCSARDHSIFVQLDSPELTQITTTKGCRTYERSEVIFLAGEKPAGVYCIHDGHVKVYKMGPDGREQIIRLAGPGDVLGYRSLISGEEYSSYAEPLGPTRICHIPRSTFFDLVTTNFDLSTRVMTLLSTELKAAEEKIVDMAQRGVGARVAETILILRETYGMEEDGMTISGKMTRVEIAGLVGAAMESVSRQLSKLKQDGAIDLVGRKIKILSVKALTDAASVDD